VTCKIKSGNVFRIGTWCRSNICSASLSSSSLLNRGHESIMVQLMAQESSTRKDDDSTSSSLAAHGLFFAKGQPLAIRAVAQMHCTCGGPRPLLPQPERFLSSSAHPPILLFASAMTPGLGMQDIGTMPSHLLIPTTACENKNQVNKQQRQRLLFLGAMLHLEAASDWDQDLLARNILDHVQEWSRASAS
jgi:hypothetical protein